MQLKMALNGNADEEPAFHVFRGSAAELVL